MARMEKNFGLSLEEFNQLVTDLKRNETPFFKQLCTKHFKSCMSFLKKQYQATNDDAYDATMDAFIQFRRLLVEGKLTYGNLNFLYTKIATQIYSRNVGKFKIQELHEKDLELLITNNEITEEEITLFNKAWNELGTACQELLKLHYYGNMKLIEIAQQRERSPATIRKQKERCIQQIRTHVKESKKIAQ